jgi:hypothetical protein
MLAPVGLLERFPPVSHRIDGDGATRSAMSLGDGLQHRRARQVKTKKWIFRIFSSSKGRITACMTKVTALDALRSLASRLGKP